MELEQKEEVAVTNGGECAADTESSSCFGTLIDLEDSPIYSEPTNECKFVWLAEACQLT